jgi:aspartyl-tRNA(Asn)/glutamyl-tRNA(Gln) amidotransferase subunit A
LTDIHRLTIAELTAAYRRGALTPRVVTEHYLARIDAHDPTLRSYTHIDRERALAAAEESGRRFEAGAPAPLEGVPIAVKANIDVEGLPTHAGVAARRNAVARRDAEVVTRLRTAGAIVLGNLNMHEAALGATTDNEAYGRAMNPHRIGHTPGGSSGGSGAAVAAGLCVAALGTDTLGSVRIPSAYNGVYGLKPTKGLVPEDGLVSLAARLDVIGPLARSVADLRDVMAAMAPLGPAEPVTKIARLDVVDGYDSDPAVYRAYELASDLLEGSGLKVQRFAAPDLDLPKVRLAGFVEAAREARAHFPEVEREPDGFSEPFRSYLGFAAGFDEAAVAQGRATLDAAAERLRAVLLDAEAILMPTAPQPAFAHGNAPVTQADFTALANIAGLPALSLPAGWSADGLPVGVQLVGRAGSEAALLDLAERLDRTLNAYAPPSAYA